MKLTKYFQFCKETVTCSAEVIFLWSAILNLELIQLECMHRMPSARSFWTYSRRAEWRNL